MSKKVLSVMLAVMLLTASFSVAYARDWDCDYSVIAKPAPELIPFPVEGEEEPIVAIIRDSNGEIVSYVPEGYLIITALSEKDEAELPEITATLEAAYDQLLPTPVTELNPGVEGYVHENAPELDPAHLAVRDLFDARLVGEYAGYLEVPGNTIEINFAADIAEDSFLMVMSNHDIFNDPEWDIVAADRLARGEGGSVGIVFDYLCPIIFVAKCNCQPEPPTPPGTGTMSFVFIGAALIIAGAGIMLLKKKTSKA